MGADLAQIYFADIQYNAAVDAKNRVPTGGDDRPRDVAAPNGLPRGAALAGS